MDGGASVRAPGCPDTLFGRGARRLTRMLQAILVVFASYLLGAVPFGLVLVRLFKGVDLRKVGSGNIGATNAMRVLGKPLGLVAFFLDAAKGLVPTLFFATQAAAFDEILSGLAASLCGIAAVLGHCFPAYLGFKGGKAWRRPVARLSAWIRWSSSSAGPCGVVALLISRFVSVASIAMGVAFPVAAAMLDGDQPAFVGSCVLLTLLIILRHRINIARIRDGSETRIGKKAPPTGLDGAGENLETS